MHGTGWRGGLIYVPSGAGKGSLLSALRGHVHGMPPAFAARYHKACRYRGGKDYSRTPGTL